MDLRLLFQNGTLKLNPNSNTTYSDWATKHGFKFSCGDSVPVEWFSEPPTNHRYVVKREDSYRVMLEETDEFDAEVLYL